MKRSQNFWLTTKCPSCGDPHYSCIGETDDQGIEYVVCPTLEIRTLSSHHSWELEHTTFIPCPEDHAPRCHLCNDYGGIILPDQTNAPPDYPASEACACSLQDDEHPPATVVTTKSTALVPLDIYVETSSVFEYDPSTDTDYQLEITQVELDTTLMQAEYNNTDLHLIETMEVLKSVNSDVVRLLENASARLLELQAQNELPPPEVKSDQESATDNDEFLQEREKLIVRCQDLFRQISSIAHPDRTTNTNLHELFMVARTARDELDYETLREIKRALRKGKTKLISKLKRRLQELQRKRAEVLAKLMSLKSSIDYQLWTLYQDERTRQSAILAHRNLSFTRLGQINAEIARLAPKSVSPQPVYQSQTIRYQLWTTILRGNRAW